MKNKFTIIPVRDHLLKPTRGHDDDAGIDFYAQEDITLHGGLTKIPLGFGIVFPKRTLSDKILGKHWHAELTQRSSQNAAGVMLMRGIIDEGYRGEIAAVFVNLSGSVIKYKAGDRIGQLLFYKERSVNSPDIKTLKKNEKRNTGGFGSTGK